MTDAVTGIPHDRKTVRSGGRRRGRPRGSDEPREGGRPTGQIDASVEFVDWNVTDPTAQEAASDAAETFGGVDILVNNAGVLEQTSFLDVTPAECNHVFDVSVK